MYIIRIYLQLLYHAFNMIVYPFELLWRYFFEIPLDPKILNKCKNITIIGICGGDGKTTLAEQITKYDFNHINFDYCKFGPKWKRFSNDEIRQNIENLQMTRNVFEGNFYDVNCPIQETIIKEWIKKSDLLIWPKIPYIVSIWRKLLRSFKRYIEVIPDNKGVDIENWYNIFKITKKTISTYHQNYNRVNGYIKDNIIIRDRPYIIISNWPYYYTAY